jgi:hypothetical protein
LILQARAFTILIVHLIFQAFHVSAPVPLLSDKTPVLAD